MDRLASSFPLRRRETVPCRRRSVAAAPAVSREVACASECCERRSARLVGLPDPALALPFPGRLRGLPTVAVPTTRAVGLSSPALRSSSELSETDPPPVSRREAPSLGFPPPSRHQPVESTTARVAPCRPRASQARDVPPSTFRTSSTASSSTGLAGLFHPAATSGVLSSGVSPRAQPHGLVARRGPLDVQTRSLPPVLPMGSVRAPSPSGLCSVRGSVTARGCLSPAPPDPLLRLSSLRFFFADAEAALDCALSRHGLSRPTRCSASTT